MALPKIAYPPLVNRFSVFLLLFISWIFLIAATAAHQWGTFSGGSVGLWGACAGSVCSSYSESDLRDCASGNVGFGISKKMCQEIQAARAFLVMAILLLSFALILSIFQSFFTHFLNLNWLTTGFLAVTFVFVLLGFALGTDALVTDFPRASGGASVGLAVISLIFIGVATFINATREVQVPAKSLNNNVDNSNNNTNGQYQANNNNVAPNVVTNTGNSTYNGIA